MDYDYDNDDQCCDEDYDYDQYCGQVISTSGATLPVLLLFSGWQQGIGEPEDESNNESESKNTGKVKKGNSGKRILPSVLRPSSYSVEVLIITKENVKVKETIKNGHKSFKQI